MPEPAQGIIRRQLRWETRGGQTLRTFTTVGKDRLTSAPARVTRTGARHTITGVTWGAPIDRVEVSIDDRPLRPARLRRQFRAVSTPGGSEPTTGARRRPGSRVRIG